MSRTLLSLAGFQVILSGRFWVIAEVGETVGNEKLANQGVVDQAKGAAKETWGNAKDAAKGVQQSHKDAATAKAHSTRDKISQSMQNAKAKVNEKIDEFKQRHSA
jgi:uncharacterized protein YjbJ (UPF0337 family)